LSFQLTYQDTQAGWSNEQCTSRARETAMLRDQLKRSELFRGEINH
jgi:hypothetical protein